MKKIISLFLVLTLSFCLSVTAFADTGGEQVLTLTVTESGSPTWTLQIPASCTLSGPGRQTIGTVAIVNVNTNGATRGIIHAMASYHFFMYKAYEIPYTMEYERSDFSDGLREYYPGGELVSYEIRHPEESAATSTATLYINIDQSDYAAAVPGTYTETITYSSAYN